MFPETTTQHGCDAQSTNRLIEETYPDLRRIARYFLSREGAGHYLQPAALVNEAYIRISVGAGVQWLDQRHFFAIAARQMQRILIDHGRKRRAAKRAAGIRVDFQEACRSAVLTDYSATDVDDLLNQLGRKNKLAAAVVHRAIFVGMTHSEIAIEMGCSRSTVKRQWDFAATWLTDQLATDNTISRTPKGVNSPINPKSN